MNDPKPPDDGSSRNPLVRRIGLTNWLLMLFMLLMWWWHVETERRLDALVQAVESLR